VTYNGSTEFLLIGQDLRVLPKKLFLRRNDNDFTRLAQLLPYSYNSLSPMICFNVEDVSRPACFVSVKHGPSDLRRPQRTLSLPVPHASVPQFWGFPLSFCDRSLYAEVSIGELENEEAMQNGLQPYILSDSYIAPNSTYAYDGNSSEEDPESDDDTDHIPIDDL